MLHARGVGARNAAAPRWAVGWTNITNESPMAESHIDIKDGVHRAACSLGAGALRLVILHLSPQAATPTRADERLHQAFPAAWRCPALSTTSGQRCTRRCLPLCAAATRMFVTHDRRALRSMGKSLQNFLAGRNKFSPKKKRAPINEYQHDMPVCPLHVGHKHRPCMGPGCKVYELKQALSPGALAAPTLVRVASPHSHSLTQQRPSA